MTTVLVDHIASTILGEVGRRLGTSPVEAAVLDVLTEGARQPQAVGAVLAWVDNVLRGDGTDTIPAAVSPRLSSNLVAAMELAEEAERHAAIAVLGSILLAGLRAALALLP